MISLKVDQKFQAPLEKISGYATECQGQNYTDCAAAVCNIRCWCGLCFIISAVWIAQEISFCSLTVG